jgi:hypothetical protein
MGHFRADLGILGRKRGKIGPLLRQKNMRRIASGAANWKIQVHREEREEREERRKFSRTDWRLLRRCKLCEHDITSSPP